MNLIKLLQLVLAVKIAGAMRLHILTKDSKILTRSGQNLTLPCVAKGRNFDPFANPLIWYKVADNGEEFQINTGAVISFPYAETGRYGVDPKLEFGKISTVGMPLGIRGLTLAENGTYRCELRSKSKVLSSRVHQIDVIGPINKLEMQSPNSHRENQTQQEVFVFYENEPSSVTCEFQGSGPPPVIHVIRGEVDITPLFVRTERIEVVGEPGLQYSIYHIKYTSTELKMQRVHNGEKLYCAAQVATFTELSITKTALIEVLYAAAFSCDTELVATVGEVDVEISCTITANPPVHLNNVWWTFSHSKWNLTNGQSKGDLSSHTTMNNGVVAATLKISNVSNSSFQTYYLNARTSLATRQHAIVLQEDVPTTLPPLTTTTATTSDFSSTSTETTRIATSPTPKSGLKSTTPQPKLPPSTTSERRLSTPSVRPTPKSTTSPQEETIKPSTEYTKPLDSLTVRSTSTPQAVTFTPTVNTETSTHKRRKHQKHKHKKKKKQKHRKDKEKSGSTEVRTTTVSFITSTKASSNSETDDVSNNPRNKTSANKTLEKHQVPGDVQYTIIDHPVKESSAKAHRPDIQTAWFCGFVIFAYCMFTES